MCVLYLVLAPGQWPLGLDTRKEGGLCSTAHGTTPYSRYLYSVQRGLEVFCCKRVVPYSKVERAIHWQGRGDDDENDHLSPPLASLFFFFVPLINPEDGNSSTSRIRKFHCPRPGPPRILLLDNHQLIVSCKDGYQSLIYHAWTMPPPPIPDIISISILFWFSLPQNERLSILRNLYA